MNPKFFQSILLMTAVCLATTSQARAIPAYAFEVGKTLLYDGTSERVDEKNTLKFKQQQKIWVAKKFSDGSFKLIVNYKSWLIEDNLPVLKADSFHYAIVTRHGEVEWNSSLNAWNPQFLLPHLPKNLKEVEEGWSGIGGKEDATIAYQSHSPNVTLPWAFHAKSRSIVNTVYEVDAATHYVFDAQGLINGVEWTRDQKFGYIHQSKGSYQRTEITSTPIGDIDKLDQDITLYYGTLDLYNDLTQKAIRQFDKTEKLLEMAKMALVQTKEALNHEKLVQAIEDAIAKHDSYYADYIKNQAEAYNAIIGTPVPEWSANDFKGTLHEGKQYKGKVVVFDFWFRGCIYCMLSIPQLKAVEEHFKSRPEVVFLGMNADKNEENAKFVIEKAQLKNTQLRAHEIFGDFQVVGFPTLLVVDQDGNIQERLLGFSRDLSKTLISTIEGLLK